MKRAGPFGLTIRELFDEPFLGGWVRLLPPDRATSQASWQAQDISSRSERLLESGRNRCSSGAECALAGTSRAPMRAARPRHGAPPPSRAQATSATRFVVLDHLRAVPRPLLTCLRRGPESRIRRGDNYPDAGGTGGASTADCDGDSTPALARRAAAERSGHRSPRSWPEADGLQRGALRLRGGGDRDASRGETSWNRSGWALLRACTRHG